MKYIPIYIIKRYSFWGVIFLLIFLLGFNVKLQDIISICFSNQLYLNYFCIYMMISIPIYVALLIWNITSLMHSNYPFGLALAFEFFMNLWGPYEDYFEVDNRSSFINKSVLILLTIFEKFSWYLLMGFGIKNISLFFGQPLFISMPNLSQNQKIVRLLILLCIYCISRISCIKVIRYYLRSEKE